MGRKAAGLTAVKVKTAKPGRYGDGNGLYLTVRSETARFWIFRYQCAGKSREMGLGSALVFSLAEARAKAGDLHKLVKSGIDPLAQRETEAAAEAAAQQEEAVRGVTFRTVAERYIAAHEGTWRNEKHVAQWKSTLETYVYPHFVTISAGAVETAHVMTALEPIWNTKPETASRVRGRIETVLDYAKSRGWREGENPARWRGHISNLLPARNKVRKVEHHAALSWREIGSFLDELKAQQGMAAIAMRFAILTAARTGEIIGAQWGEINLGTGTWTIPAERMKAHREHRVPLSVPALDIVGALAKLRTGRDDKDHVFTGLKGSPLSNMAMTATLRRMDRGEITVHGFRSSFRDWAAEATSYPPDVAEAALAHNLGNKTQVAYQRGDLFEKRRRLMDEWATFCSQPARVGSVSAIRGNAASL